jgi:hypothetical protein
MAALIGFVLGEFEFEFFVLGLLCAIVSILRIKGRAGDRLLAYYVLFSVGGLHLVNFVYHVFFGAMSARFIGWADSPFQTELGFASLGFALVGFIAWRGSYGMRVAAVLGPTPFLLGAAGGHIYQIMTTGNHAAGNSGLLLWMDFIIPLTGLLFLATAKPPAATASMGARNPGARGPILR